MYARIHWRIFNFMARSFGLLALIFGVISTLSAVLTWNVDRDLALVYAVVALFCAALAGSFLTVTPYRPDLVGPIPRDRRSWWTGEPK
jgi:hypothetical protein